MDKNEEGLDISLDLHYYLDNDKPEFAHVMDAKIHNRCESAIIDALTDFTTLFDGDISIGVSSIENGGVVDKLKLFFADETTKYYFSRLLRFMLLGLVKEDYFLTESQTQLNRLELLEKIKKQNLTDQELEFIVKGNPKFITSKNKFYDSVRKESRVTHINFRAYDGIGQNENGETIYKKDFAKQIENNTTREFVTNHKAVTLLVYSPVLHKGSKAKWSGLLMNEEIKFQISDKLFLQQVYNKEVPFTTGTCLSCDVKKIVTCKYDVSGILVKEDRAYIVSNITSWSDENIVQHRTKRYIKAKQEEAIPSLFSDKDFE